MKAAVKETAPPRREFVDWENHPDFVKLRETQEQSKKLVKMIAMIVGGVILFFILVTSCSFKKSLDPVMDMEKENKRYSED